MIKSTIFACAAVCAAALAAPPQVHAQVPGYFRLMVGETEVTALYDGAVYLKAGFFHGLPEERLDALLAARFQDAKRIPTATSSYLVHTKDRLVLIDAGAARCFGPDAGRLPSALRAAGYAPEDIDTVLLTHMHGDHVCGLLNQDGTLAFPNATVWASKVEAAWWLDDANAAKVPEGRRGMFKMAQTPLAPYRAAGRFRTFDGDIEVLPGIRAVATPGHTPGHTAYLVSSDGDALLVFGDVLHSIAMQFAHPDVSYEFDSDQSLANASRRAIFAEIVKHGWMIAGAHLPFPGIGRLRLNGDGYAFVPVEYREIK